MARLAREDIEEINDSGELNTVGAVPQVLHDVWRIEWTGRCVDPGCRARDHHFLLALTVHQALQGEPMPTGKVAVMIDGRVGNIPLDKNTIAELIQDLQQMLDTLP